MYIQDLCACMHREGGGGGGGGGIHVDSGVELVEAVHGSLLHCLLYNRSR